MRFFPFPPADDPWRSDDDAFMLLRPGKGEGTILHTTDGGRAVVYDADARAISATVPSFGKGMGREPVVFSVPGTGESKESLYVMRSTIMSPVHNPPPATNEDGCSGDFVLLDFNEPFKSWQPLPRPPFVVDKEPPAGSPFHIRSSAVVDGGRTIVVSSNERMGGVVDAVAEFTYCFDTGTRQWRHAGDWALPFHGRAEYVPELGTWIGLSSTPPHHLCAVDLSSAMDDAHRAPTPQHVWDDFTPPADMDTSQVLNRRYPQYLLQRSTEWWPWGGSLVNLGSGRFCTLKLFDIRRMEWVGSHEPDWPDEEVFTVLTGVEVVCCNNGEEEGGLRMVKHKSKRVPVTLKHWLF